MEKGGYSRPTRTVLTIMSHLNQAVPSLLTDESETLYPDTLR